MFVTVAALVRNSGFVRLRMFSLWITVGLLHYTIGMEPTQPVLELAIAISALLQEGGAPRVFAAALAIQQAFGVDTTAVPRSSAPLLGVDARLPPVPQPLVEPEPAVPAPPAAPPRAAPSSQEECAKVFAIRNKREDIPTIITSTPNGWSVEPGAISPGDWMAVLHNSGGAKGFSYL
jgi:hypothetical protein